LSRLISWLKSSKLNFSQVRTDVLSGITIALALVPEAVAFSFIAGVEPIISLYGAAIVGIIASMLGGRPGLICGATGPLSLVIVALVAQHGLEYMFAAGILMGIIQILFGVFKFGKFVRLLPHSVMLGFVNGVAIIIFMSQLGQFQTTLTDGTTAWLTGGALYTLLGLTAFAMLIIQFFPKITNAVPSSLVAIGAVTALALALNLDVATVGSYLQSSGGGSISGSLPSFSFPMVPLTFETLEIILPYAFILAAINTINTLINITLIDDITETRGNSNKEFIGQGIANIFAGCFGAQSGGSMIGQSMINIASGGRGRISGFVGGFGLLLIIVFFAPYIELIPIAALVGVMFMVVIGTFSWSSLRILGKIPKMDAFVLVFVSAVTVFSNLATAVGLGIIISAVSFSWEKGKRIQKETFVDEKGYNHHQLSGPLFFASIKNFEHIFDPAHDSDEVYIDFSDSRVVDHSAIQAINSLAAKYRRQGKVLHLAGLSEECAELLRRVDKFTDISVIEDEHYTPNVTIDHLALKQSSQ
jgi:SulP family sulfate permease